ncbi:SMI1 / KNR4 family protein [Polystyrenella longa]|uniref:SMI1 / KNR4 family protein n=1 Tax=Polystyrenella longa TaxID=2528007 RepID=A0A518CQY4_9PLAN|nr:SMI1/KNR4 family protein [Polystyrenella longa]QDU81620.1 SMI1 / KNR4 family protein [Polystyrenella longa]
MPFPVDLKYILDAEEQLQVKLPSSLSEYLQRWNGAEIEIEEDDWQVFSVLDKSNRKQIARSWNDIVSGNKSASSCAGFPPKAIAIAQNGSGDYLVLLPHIDNPSQLNDCALIWDHETGVTTEVDKLSILLKRRVN